MNLYLVRHGETDWNAEGRAQGRADMPLNARGLTQSAAIADHLRDVPLAAVYTSPATRARMTAEAIASPHGLTPQVVEGLQEMDLGALDGALLTEMRERFPEFFRQWTADAGTARFPGSGECLEDVQQRAWTALGRMLAAHRPEDDVAAISHTFTLYAVLCRALGMPLANYDRLRQETGALSLLRARRRGGDAAGEARWQVVFLNQTHHLRDQARGR